MEVRDLKFKTEIMMMFYYYRQLVFAFSIEKINRSISDKNLTQSLS